MDPQQQPIAPSVRRRVPPPEVLPSYAPTKFLYFSGTLFFITLFIYVGLATGYTSFLENSISNLEEELDELSFQISQEQQENIAQLYSQVNNLQKALSEHVEATELFKVLEENTDASVAYTDVNISIPDNEVSIEGVANSYDDLVSQLAIYEQAPEIKRMILESSQTSEGVVRFKINLTMMPEVFIPRI